MKKIGYVLLILILTLAITLTGCGGSESASDAGQTDGAQAEQSKDAAATDTAGMEGLGDLLSSAYVDMMKSNEYLMEYKVTMEFEGQTSEVKATVAVKGDDTAMTTNGQGVESTIIIKDDKMFMVDHASKTVTSLPQSEEVMPEMETETLNTEGIEYIRSGNEDGLVYEEYSILDGTVKYYFDGKDLVRMTITIDGQETRMDILKMSKDVPGSMFEIPAGYQMIEM